MTTPTTGPASCEAVRAALVELLTIGQHHHAATPATLSAVGAAHRALAERHCTLDPAARCAPPDRRLTALTAALGNIGSALFAVTPWQPLDTAALRTGLTELAAVALGWLDTLDPPPTEPDPDPADDGEPF